MVDRWVRPGTVTGAALLILAVGLVAAGATLVAPGTRGGPGVVVVPGVLITLAAAAGAAWLTSSTAVGVALPVALPTARHRNPAQPRRRAQRSGADSDHP